MSEAFFVDFKSPRPWILLAGFMIIVVGVGAIIGTQSVPGALVRGARQAAIQSAQWDFWSSLVRALRHDRGRRMAHFPGRCQQHRNENLVWPDAAQLVLVADLVVAQLIWPAFAIIVALWLLIVFFTVVAAKIDKSAAWLFVPYLGWVSFAGLLNFSIGILN